MEWAAWLGIYVGYALLMALIFNTSVTSSHLPFEGEQLADLVELVVNNLFLIVVINWASSTDGKRGSARLHASSVDCADSDSTSRLPL
jgi:hypothetical protein